MFGLLRGRRPQRRRRESRPKDVKGSSPIRETLGRRYSKHTKGDKIIPPPRLPAAIAEAWRATRARRFAALRDASKVEGANDRVVLLSTLLRETAPEKARLDAAFEVAKTRCLAAFGDRRPAELAALADDLSGVACDAGEGTAAFVGDAFQTPPPDARRALEECRGFLRDRLGEGGGAVVDDAAATVLRARCEGLGGACGDACRAFFSAHDSLLLGASISRAGRAASDQLVLDVPRPSCW